MKTLANFVGNKNSKIKKYKCSSCNHFYFIQPINDNKNNKFYFNYRCLCSFIKNKLELENGELFTLHPKITKKNISICLLTNYLEISDKNHFLFDNKNHKYNVENKCSDIENDLFEFKLEDYLDENLKKGLNKNIEHNCKSKINYFCEFCQMFFCKDCLNLHDKNYNKEIININEYYKKFNIAEINNIIIEMEKKNEKIMKIFKKKKDNNSYKLLCDYNKLINKEIISITNNYISLFNKSNLEIIDLYFISKTLLYIKKFFNPVFNQKNIKYKNGINFSDYLNYFSLINNKNLILIKQEEKKVVITSIIKISLSTYEYDNLFNYEIIPMNNNKKIVYLKNGDNLKIYNNDKLEKKYNLNCLKAFYLHKNSFSEECIVLISFFSKKARYEDTFDDDEYDFDNEERSLVIYKINFNENDKTKEIETYKNFSINQIYLKNDKDDYSVEKNFFCQINNELFAILSDSNFTILIVEPFYNMQIINRLVLFYNENIRRKSFEYIFEDEDYENNYEDFSKNNFNGTKINLICCDEKVLCCYDEILNVGMLFDLKDYDFIGYFRGNKYFNCGVDYLRPDDRIKNEDKNLPTTNINLSFLYKGSGGYRQYINSQNYYYIKRSVETMFIPSK